jgi:hypothetical protein
MTIKQALIHGAAGFLMEWAGHFPAFVCLLFLYYTICAVVHHALEKFAKL